LIYSRAANFFRFHIPSRGQCHSSNCRGLHNTISTPDRETMIRLTPSCGLDRTVAACHSWSGGTKTDSNNMLHFANAKCPMPSVNSVCTTLGTIAISKRYCICTALSKTSYSLGKRAALAGGLLCNFPSKLKSLLIAATTSARAAPQRRPRPWPR
jgi:hypothetical protein